MVEVELNEHLLNIEEITSFVEDRIYPLTAPENSETPYITYQNISDNDLTDYEGVNYANKTRFQIDVFAETYAEAKQIKGAIKKAMYQFKYHMYDFSARDLYEHDTKLQRQLIDFKLNT